MVETVQPPNGSIDTLNAELPCPLHSIKRGIGFLASFGIRTGVLPQFFPRPCHIQHVVGDLKRQSNVFGITRQRFQLGWSSIGKDPTNPDGSPNESSGFIVMNRLECDKIEYPGSPPGYLTLVPRPCLHVQIPSPIPG